MKLIIAATLAASAAAFAPAKVAQTSTALNAFESELGFSLADISQCGADEADAPGVPIAHSTLEHTPPAPRRRQWSKIRKGSMLKSWQRRLERQEADLSALGQTAPRRMSWATEPSTLALAATPSARAWLVAMMSGVAPSLRAWSTLAPADISLETMPR